MVASNGWRVRPIRMREMKSAVDIQAEAFHDTPRIKPLDGLVKMSFRAEVLEAMKAKLTASPLDFKCLIAEADDGSSGVVGVVDISLQDSDEVLEHMPESSEPLYSYVASMAVRDDARRQGVATALLEAVEEVAKNVFKTQGLYLHVFAANQPAIDLYKCRGFDDVYQEPDSLWSKLGKKPRHLLGKRF